MGILGDEEEESVDEVKISASDGSSNEGEADLMNEVESKFGSSSSKSNDKGNSSSSVNLDDIHRQNEKIISLLEDIKEDSSDEVEADEDMIGGDMNGVL